MYQSLFPILKPLVYEGKSGVLHVVHEYDDEASIYLKEGIVVQVKTSNLSGNKAASACSRWVSISTRFKEGDPGTYVADQEINTTSLLSYLEKAQKNITIIAKNIEGNHVVYRIDSDRLHAATKLNKEDFKVALLFDGKRTLADVVRMAEQSELAVLTHTCKLILAGVASAAPTKKIMQKQDRIDFLSALNQQLIELVGPAGPVLVDDAFKTIGSHPYTLALEEIPDLLTEVGVMLDDSEKEIIARWSEQYMKKLKR